MLYINFTRILTLAVLSLAVLVSCKTGDEGAISTESPPPEPTASPVTSTGTMDLWSDGLFYPSLDQNAAENLKYTSLTTTGATDANNYGLIKASSASATTTAWGALNCHDPQIFRDDDGTWYAFSTDASIGGTWTGGIQVRKSTDLIHWTCLAKPAFGAFPAEMVEWCQFDATGSDPNKADAGIWAPCVIKFNGKYYMYYGMNADVTVSGQAKAHAYIGVATADKAEGPYTHLAKIVRSTTLANDPTTVTGDSTLCTNTSYGAIDPSIVWDANGDMWMNYGSWRQGIAILRLDNATGLPLAGDTDAAAAAGTANAYGIRVAGGGGAAYEGAQVWRHGDYYYVFISSGDLNTDYSVRVGRRALADGIAGPYCDKDGYALTGVTYTGGSANNFHLHGAKVLGSYVMGTELSWRAPGGVCVAESDGKFYMAVHCRTNFLAGWYFYLQVRQMFFTDDGWPVVNPNEYAGEELQAVSATQFAATYDSVLSVRTGTYGTWADDAGTAGNSNTNIADAEPTASISVTFNADGSIGGGTYTGTWSIYDGCKIGIVLKDSSGTAIDTFQGVVVSAYDGSREKKSSLLSRATLSFTAMGSKGEYFFGNRHW